MRVPLGWQVVPVLLLLTACAAGMDPHPRPVSVGLAKLDHLAATTPRLLERHGFVLDRADGSGSSYRAVSHWKIRDPFDDERELGVSEARDRVVVSGYLRDTDLVGVYRITVELESLARNGDGEWTAAHRTPLAERHLRRITADFRAEFGTGAHLRR